MFTLRVVGISEREKEKEKSGVEKRWRPWGLSLVLWGVGIARDCESGESMSICVCGSRVLQVADLLLAVLLFGVWLWRWDGARWVWLLR